MKIFQTIVKRIVQIVGGGTGVVASEVKPGIEQTIRVNLLDHEIDAGVFVEANRFTARPEPIEAGIAVDLLGAQVSTTTAVDAGVALSASPASVSPAAFPVNTGIALSDPGSNVSPASFPINTGIAATLLGVSVDAAKPQNDAGITTSVVGPTLKETEVPAVSITRIKYDLVRRVGADSVTETAVGGRTDWTNDANVTGMNNGTLATITGNALGARGGQLELGYANSANKSDLTITSAKLHFYGSVTGTALNNADVQLKYDIGAGFVTLETITGDATFTSTPKTHDISASLTTWAQYDALRTACYANAAALELWTANLDAVEVEIIATRTDTF